MIMKNQSYFKNIQVPLIKKHIKHFGLEGRPSLLQGVRWPWPLNFGPIFFPTIAVWQKNHFNFYELKWFPTKK